MHRKLNEKQLKLKALLDQKIDQYNRPGFIPMDPVSIPHRYTKKEDIEITGFWTSILAWGQRVTIINKATELFQLMDNEPHDFIKNHTEKDRERFLHSSIERLITRIRYIS